MNKIQYRSVRRYKYQMMSVYQIDVETGGASWQTPFLSIFNGSLVIEKGYCWDGPSGPSIDTENFMRGSLVHDALYQLLRLHALDPAYRDYSDLLLWKICREDGMSAFRAWYVWKAVSWFGAKNARPTDGE